MWAHGGLFKVDISCLVRGLGASNSTSPKNAPGSPAASMRPASGNVSGGDT